MTDAVGFPKLGNWLASTGPTAVLLLWFPRKINPETNRIAATTTPPIIIGDIVVLDCVVDFILVCFRLLAIS